MQTDAIRRAARTFFQGAIGRRPGFRVDLALVSSRSCPGQGGKGKTRQSKHRAQSAVDDGEPFGVVVNDGEVDLRAGVCCVHRGGR